MGFGSKRLVFALAPMINHPPGDQTLGSVMKILVLGGTQFFGKRLVRQLIQDHHAVTLLTRGRRPDEFGAQIARLKCDRTDPHQLKEALGDQRWDLVFDQTCMSASDARAVCEILAQKVGFYVFTSTQSVYASGAALVEEDFLPEKHPFEQVANSQSDYPEAKRQAESVFAQKASFPVAMARIPIVLGEDDYTERLWFHVDRIRRHLPIYFPNLAARLSLIDAEDAAQALYKVGTKKLMGPINLAAPEPIQLAQLVGQIEVAVGHTAAFSEEARREIWSPFGIEQDWFMNTGHAIANGIETRTIDQWLPTLIQKLAARPKEQK